MKITLYLLDKIILMVQKFSLEWNSQMLCAPLERERKLEQDVITAMANLR